MDNIQKRYLVESARWEKLLGVLMMICTVIIALVGVFFIVLGFVSGDEVLGSDVLGKLGGAMLGILYLLLAVLYYFFAIYLLRAAKSIKAWDQSDDDAALTDGLKNTMSFFRLTGIVSIIGICSLGFAIVGVAVAAIVALV